MHEHNSHLCVCACVCVSPDAGICMCAKEDEPGNIQESNALFYSTPVLKKKFANYKDSFAWRGVPQTIASTTERKQYNTHIHET